MKNIIITICIIATFAACISAKAPTIPSLGDINPTTGNAYTSEEIEAVRHQVAIDSKEEGILDRLLSTKILIIFAFGALACVLGAVICAYQISTNPKMIWGAGSCAAGAILCVALPVLIVAFFKTVEIVLYILGGFLVLCAAIGIYWFWRKMERKHKANVSLVGTVEEYKKELSPDSIASLRDKIIDKHDTVTNAEVDKIKRGDLGK